MDPSGEHMFSSLAEDIQAFSTRPFVLWCFSAYLVVLALQGLRAAVPDVLISDLFTMLVA